MPERRRVLGHQEWRTATRKGEEGRSHEPIAATAWYDVQEDLVVVGLDNGTRFSFPPSLAQGLAGASAEELNEIEVVSGGTGLHWESLDADLGVDALVRGLFGSPQWAASRKASISQLAGIAGRVSTPKKAAAARENGKRGGRPRKCP